MNTNPSKKSKRKLFRQSKKHQKCTQKHLLFKIWMFLNLIDLLNYCVVKKNLIFNILPTGSFWKKDLKSDSSWWLLDQNHWFNFFFHFAPRGTTDNLTFLNPLCTSRLNSYDDIEEFTVKLFSVQFSTGFYSRKALDLCFYMQKTEVLYLV